MLDKIFDAKSFEENYSFDIEASTRVLDAEPFMILLPPPNITGSLHIGHALCYTLQDIIARYKRLKGYDVLFQPGIDHAGIVTQLLVEKQIYASGVEKGSLTREKLLKEIWFWKENSGATIIRQLKKLGISCDFSRLRFTLDEKSKKAVSTMFVSLYNSGLLYRGQRIINWDPLIGSAISDLEINEKEVDGHLWHIRYMMENDKDSIVIATSRPETIFGDVAIAVNPSDTRYKKFVGKKVKVPLIDRLIPVIEDKYADPKKGSGAVKITPAHDFNDYDVGIRNKLPIIDIFNEKAELNDKVPEMFQGMDRFEARSKVVELLEKTGALVEVENIKQMLPFGDRSGVVLEPRVTYQWFVNAEKLARRAIKVVKEEKMKFVPKHWENLYFEWLNNIRPWCVSRQIWWGHRIPAWYGPDGQVFVAEDEQMAKKQAVKFYGKYGVKLTQDEDVLDTWFSSGMWPFITLGWPEKTEELERFYSNMVVVTGFDIIFFWVARMIMMGMHSMNEVPFKEVYIHGLVRDKYGNKMSKSKGNVINPLDLCDKYGADAVRYTLAYMSSPGRDIKMSDQVVETGRNFLTKLWNVVRFSQMNGCVYNKAYRPNKISHPLNKWIIYETKRTVKLVEDALQNYRFDDAARYIYQGVWNSLCDWYMEFVKPILQHSSITDENLSGYDLEQTLLKKDVRDTVAWVIVQFVRILYPIAPFISKKLSGELGSIDIVWPETDKIDVDFNDAIKQIELLKEIITSIRSLKKGLHLPANKELNISLEGAGIKDTDFIKNYEEIIFSMTKVTVVEHVGKSVPVVLNGAILRMEIDSNVDINKEIASMKKELESNIKMRDAVLFRLGNEDFKKKASEEVIEEHNNRIAILSDKIFRAEYIIRSLEEMR